MEFALALIFGIVIGSFLNVCIARLPQGVSIAVPRSFCPHCKTPIAWYDNIPVLSYLILAGRARCCRKPISARYPFVELVSGLVSVLLYLKFGFGLEWLIFFFFSGALIVLAFIDIDHRILPDPITLNGIWVGLIVSVYLAQPSPLAGMLLRWLGFSSVDPRLVALFASILGMVAGGGLLWLVGEAFFRLRGVEGLGFGDVKMMAMVGAFLGAPLTLLTMMVGSLTGSVIGLLWIRVQGKDRQYELPFGTFLSFAAILAVLYGEDIIRVYVNHVIGGLGPH
jgi:leader peptidase (prepilin peptidase)/N-methyltransferase